MKKKEWIKIFIVFLISYYFTYILTNYFFVNNPYSTISSNSILAIFLLIIIFYLLMQLVTEKNRKKIFFTIWASCIFAGIIVLSKQFVETHTFDLNFRVFVIFLILWCIIEAVLIFLFNHFMGINLEKIKVENIFSKKKYVFFVWLVMFLCWLPALFAMFPGNFAYDAWPQVSLVLVKHQLNSSHPVIHTLFLNACMVIGKSIFKSYNAGVLIYSIIQGILMSGMFTLCIYRLYQWKTGIVFLAGTFVFFAFNPIIQIFAFTITKDVLFGGMFLVVIVYSFEIIKDTESFFTRKSSIMRYAICVILMCMLRNQGKYVFMVFVPFLVISVKNYRKKCLILGCSLVVVVNLILGPVSTALGIEKGNMREMFSVPMQQLARVWNNNQGSLTEEEKNVITNIIPVKYLKQYEEYSADPVKTGFDTEEFKENIGDFIKVWFSVGLKNPEIYLESFFLGGYQYWYIGPRGYVYDAIFYDGSYMTEQYDTLKITRHTLLEGYDEYLRNISFGYTYNKLPVISVMFTMAFPFWLVIIAISMLMCMNKFKYISVFILPIGYWGTCLLGPVAMLRYAFPLMVGVPVYMGMVIAVKREMILNSDIQKTDL